MTVIKELTADRLAEQLLAVQEGNQKNTRLDGWFYIQEIRMETLQALRASGKPLPPRVLLHAKLFEAVCRQLPLSIHPGEIFAGTQDDAFARSYALINPDFRVETFSGYCDPMAVYNDITPAPELGITAERIKKVRDFWAQEEFARTLNEAYAPTGLATREAVYFVEQVTGHTIADFQPALAKGLAALAAEAAQKGAGADGESKSFYEAMVIVLNAVMHLAERYADLAGTMAAKEKNLIRRADLERIAATCRKVPRNGAENLFEAMQAFILLWMGMALEQSPNPYAFSVGNLDRILQPYYAKSKGLKNESAIELARHLLALFNVGDRNWAISQNIMVGGRDELGKDLTCDMTFIVLEAFYKSNYPQPALSVKLHSKTPKALHDALEPFFATPGSVTPSFFNDDVLFEVLRRKGIREQDIPQYAIAGCQEPLIMGRESGNTTNSWLNLAKILELTIHGGKSAISGKQIGLDYKQMSLNPEHPLQDMAAFRQAFWKQLDHFLPQMEKAANACTRALALLPVPFLSAFMGGLQTGRDMRDVTVQGTKYNAAGCLIHGLSVAADSFAALQYLHDHEPTHLCDLPQALLKRFQGYDELHAVCLAAPKYGNDDDTVDAFAVNLTHEVSLRVGRLKNPWGNAFLPDWSTPSTHLLYGYWVGATPDGRNARNMLGYGIDPTWGTNRRGLPPRIMSMHKLDYCDFTGGYASHIGLRRSMFKKNAPGSMIQALREYVIAPLFGYAPGAHKGGFYVYLNIDSAEHLRKILKNPRRMVPSGIYIMRIHGTFVNFLDLSPAIQEDIIKRLELDCTCAQGGI